MKRTAQRGASQRSSDAVKKRWTKLLAHGDAQGIDDDVEALLDRVQQAQGGSRDLASAELVRRLSFAA